VFERKRVGERERESESERAKARQQKRESEDYRVSLFLGIFLCLLFVSHRQHQAAFFGRDMASLVFAYAREISEREGERERARSQESEKTR